MQPCEVATLQKQKKHPVFSSDGGVILHCQLHWQYPIPNKSMTENLPVNGPMIYKPFDL